MLVELDLAAAEENGQQVINVVGNTASQTSDGL